VTVSQIAAPQGRALPDGFLVGAATAAFQIEGATSEDGRGRSIWDTFAGVDGAVLEGDTGDPACDHYHRWEADLDLLAWLGVGAYRFSVAWPRIQPDGRGPWEARGLAFYDRLVDGLLSRDIAPWVTLYHWDLPQPLEDAGGWPSRDTAYRFADYASAVYDRLGDRAAGWITLNEPWCSAFLGYAAGVHAPGRREGDAAVRAVHHLLLGHGLAAAGIRSRDAKASVGITLNLYPVAPASPSDVDADAARRIDGLANRIFLDPVLKGAYPADVVADLGGPGGWTHVHGGDLATIAAPLDFLGVNYYSPHTVRGTGGRAAVPDDGDENDQDPGAGAGGQQVRVGSPWVGSPDVEFVDTGLPKTAMGWEVDPDGLRQVLARLDDDYACPPLYVTENGAAYADEVVDDKVSDPERQAYLAAHVGALLDAVDAGVDVRGYFVWSLLDNFEWSFGYTRRFGIVHVDYRTQVRTPKASADWYRSLATSRRLPPGE
jgi:beta-glucosidase